MTNLPYTNQTPHCPNRAQWLRYRRGQTDPEETHAVESHFTDCPLCSEAVDFIMQTEPDSLQTAWDKLPNELTAPSTPLKKTHGFSFAKQFSAAAAMVACLLGAYWLYTKTTQEQTRPLAQNEANIKINKQVPDTLTTKATANTNIVKTNKKTLPSSIKQVQPNHKEQNIAQNKVATPQANQEALSTENYKALKDTKENAIDLARDNFVMAAPATEAVSKNRLKEATKKEEQAVASDEYASAAGKRLKTSSGTDLYRAKQFKACIPLLENDLKESPALGLNALYLADAYIKTGKKRAARKLLQQIVEQNGPNEKEAQQMLDLLEKK
jgi:FimV-like protein